MSRINRAIGIGVLAVATISAGLWWVLANTGGYNYEFAAQNRLQYMRQALLEYARSRSRFPTEAEGLPALVQQGLLNQAALIDPSGNTYLYKCEVSNCSVVTVSSVSGARIAVSLNESKAGK